METVSILIRTLFLIRPGDESQRQVAHTSETIWQPAREMAGSCSQVYFSAHLEQPYRPERLDARQVIHHVADSHL